jgi:hypothetical protein
MASSCNQYLAIDQQRRDSYLKNSKTNVDRTLGYTNSNIFLGKTRTSRAKQSFPNQKEGNMLLIAIMTELNIEDELSPTPRNLFMWSISNSRSKKFIRGRYSFPMKSPRQRHEAENKTISPIMTKISSRTSWKGNYFLLYSYFQK